MDELSKLKKLLGIRTKGQDFIFQFVLDKARDLIFNYCNISQMPKGLENVWLNISIDIYRAENLGNEESRLQVTSIKRGDTSTQFSTATLNENTQPETAYLTRYLQQLKAYRKLRW